MRFSSSVIQQKSPYRRNFRDCLTLGFHIIVGDVAAFFKAKLALNQILIWKPVTGGEKSWPLSYL